MGGDGGSIPTREDLVRTKRSSAKQDSIEHQRQLFNFCSLSREPLVTPIVSCSLGKLYNKVAIISYLLAPSTAYGPQGYTIASHIKSLKDVTTLHLTPNPTLLSLSNEELEASSNAGTLEGRVTSLFVCPISLREMNGSVPFVYRKPNGSVLSLASLKEMRKSEGVNFDSTMDPVTGQRDPDGAPKESWFTINPGAEETERMREEMEARKVEEKELKKLGKDRKRKANKDTSALTHSTSSDSALTATTAAASSESMPPPPDRQPKKSKLSQSTPAVAVVPLAPSRPAMSLSATIADKIAAEKKNQSAAVLSLYAPKNQDPNKNQDGSSNWMTRSCYTRYA